MKEIPEDGLFKKDSQEKVTTLYGQSISSPPHLFHVTQSPFNNVWYVKEMEKATYSVHTSREKALQEAKELASDEENGQVILHRRDGLLEIIEKEPRW